MAGEYDGFYHDEEDLRKNPFCDNMNDFATMKVRDSVKNKISFENNVIFIRLKERDGFNRRKLLHSQKEVIKEIILQFNEQVKDLFGLDGIQIEYDPNIRFDPLGDEGPHQIKDSLDDFL